MSEACATPVTTYTVHLGGEEYPFRRAGIAQALAEAGARLTAATEGQADE
jgi:hypothetical protein